MEEFDILDGPICTFCQSFIGDDYCECFGDECGNYRYVACEDCFKPISERIDQGVERVLKNCCAATHQLRDEVRELLLRCPGNWILTGKDKA